MKKTEFSKLMIITDYIFMLVLTLFSLIIPDISNIAIAWIAQLAVSTGFYYWKAKNENRIKIPVQLLSELNDDDKSLVDLTQVITTIIEKD